MPLSIIPQSIRVVDLAIGLLWEMLDLLLQCNNGADSIDIKQILFLIGLTIIIGPSRTVVFFARRQKLKGTAAFAAGIVLILIKWAFVGFVVELYGIFVLFGDFLATIAGFVGNVPMIGPYIADFLEKISGGKRNKELPV